MKTDIDIKNFASQSGIELNDNILLVLENGNNGKIKLDLLIKYMKAVSLKGDTGKSSYDIAVEGGYVGTLEQFAQEQSDIASNSSRLISVENYIAEHDIIDGGEISTI